MTPSPRRERWLVRLTDLLLRWPVPNDRARSALIGDLVEESTPGEHRAPTAAAAVAGFVPALRASSTDPVEALRV